MRRRAEGGAAGGSGYSAVRRHGTGVQFPASKRAVKEGDYLLSVLAITICPLFRRIVQKPMRGKLMQLSKNIVAGAVGAILFLGTVGNADRLMAQELPQNTNSVLRNNKYQSSGIRTEIMGTNVKGDAITVQLAVHNDTIGRMYLFWVGNFDAALSSGEFFVVDNVVGITYCKGYNTDNQQNMTFCMREKAKDLNYYSAIDKDSFSIMSIRFVASERDFKLKPDSLLSFVVKFVARSAPSDTSIVGDEKGVSTPMVITINFPLIPITQQNN